MFTQLSHSTKALLFYCIAFGLAVLMAAVGQGLGDEIRMVYMFTPLTAVLLMLLVLTRDGYTRVGWQMLGVHRAGWRSWPLAVLGPLLVLSCTYGIVWTAGIGRLDLSQYPITPDLLINLIVGLLVSSLIAFAEEIGWRGYLLPHLLPLGRVRALLISGLLHGIWHLPLILMTPFYHGTGNRLIVVTLFLLTLTAAGIFYGYLRLQSDSVWPVALAHGAFNTFWDMFTTLTVAVGLPLTLEYLAGETGIFTLVGVLVMVVWLLYHTKQPAPPMPVTPRLVP